MVKFNVYLFIYLLLRFSHLIFNLMIGFAVEFYLTHTALLGIVMW